MKTALVAVAAVFLAAHLALLPPTLEDIDSINFALGVRDFDVARHQPHPPGYPLFVAAGKASTAAFRAIGVPSPEPRALALWSALAGTALVFLLFALYRALDGTERRAWWATVVAVASPLFWFTALRPLSDMTGLATAVAAQALLVSVATGRARGRALLGGAFLAGFAIGVRSQTFVLTLPLLAWVILVPGIGLRLAQRIAAVSAASLGILAWAVPLLVASGGLEAYAEALGTQAGEDFAGVVMLWTAGSARVAADALAHTLLWPWGSLVAGAVVTALAAAGALSAAWRFPRGLLLLLVAYVPYAVFHLLFQEFVTVRYALPLVVPAAYLATLALDGAGRRILPAGAAIIAIWSLAVTLPASAAYGTHGSPTFRLLDDLPAAAARQPRPVDIGFHAMMRRAVQWEADSMPGRVLSGRHGEEWLALVAAWREAPDRDLLFVANPRRTDLALFDPRARRLVKEYRWTFAEPPFVGGARPGNADLYAMRAPGWMLDRGWALTAEVGGLSARDNLGPHRAPAVAWVRARREAALLMIGGRHLGGGTDPAARVTLATGGTALEEFEVHPGDFFRVVPVPAGGLAVAKGQAYLGIEVTSGAADDDGLREVPVALEQFDLQPDGVPMVGLEDGWHEPEYNQALGRPWRWMSDRAVAWVRPIGRDVTLTLAGESPLRYFDRPSSVRVRVGATEVARFSTASDFTESIVLPGDALAAAEGRVEIESDQSFVPGERDGTADRRRLALRMYDLRAR